MGKWVGEQPSSGRISRLLTSTRMMVVILCGLTLAGCGSSGGSDVSLVTGYSSIPDLTKASDVIVEVTATPTTTTVPADRDGTSGRLSTVTDVLVVKSIVGPVSTTLHIRQLGTGDDADPATPLLKAGDHYILFLQKFTFGPGSADSGQFVVTGDQGVYRLSGATATLVSPAVAGLPTTISSDSLIATATGAADH